MWGLFCIGGLLGCAWIHLLHKLPALAWVWVLVVVGSLLLIIWGVSTKVSLLSSIDVQGKPNLYKPQFGHNKNIQPTYSDYKKYNNNSSYLSSINFLRSNNYPSSSNFLGNNNYPSSSNFLRSNNYPSSSNFLGSNNYPSSINFLGSNNYLSSINFLRSNNYPSSINFLGSNNYLSSINFLRSNNYPSSINFLGNNNYPDSSNFLGNNNRFNQIIQHNYLKFILLFLSGLCLMAGYTLYQAHQRLADTLSPQHENKVSRLTLRVNDIARFSPGSITFDVEVLSAHGIASGIPRFIRVYWSQTKQFQLYQEIQVASMPNVRSGQVWDMWLLLKRPNTLMNPGGFDNESYLFRENIRALGTVKGQPQLLQQAQHTFHTQIQAWRHDLRKAMQSYVEGKRYGAVLIALVMGDQEGISQEDWQLFNRTGMSHLVSISGSHITVLSALATVLCLWGLRRIRYRGNLLAHYCDITWIAAGVGVMVALFYCLLAGWGIPAQRTFFMLLLTYLLHGSSVRLSLPTIFLIIAIVVSIFDPWALLSAGFYLSFAAVAVLQQLSVRFRSFSTKSSLPLQGKVRLSHKGVRFLKEWLLLQGMVTVAAVPFLMYFFHQVSLISPVVNAYAIFLIGMVVTPLSLCMGGLSVLAEIFPSLVVVVQWLADIAHNVLQWVMQVSAWLSTWRWASVDTSDVPIWALGLCGIGIVLLIMPKGLPLQRYGLLFVAPAFLLVDRTLQAGEWQLYAFDIGQGGSVLVKTANHALLFDTGVRVSPTNESGSRVLLPAFRALGVKTLDTLVVSHADIDHSGGLKTVLENIPVARIYASFQVDKFLQQQSATPHPLTGVFFQVDKFLQQQSAAPHPLTILERDAQQIGMRGQQQSKISLSQASELPPLLVKWLAEGTADVCQQGVSFVFDEVRFRFLNRHPALSAPQINSLNSLPTPQGKVLSLLTPQGKVLALPTPQGKVLSLSTPQGKVLSLAGETSSFSTMYLQRPMSQSKATLPFALSSTTRLPVPLKSSNQQSCVLSIEGKYHRALLTGDITRMQEQSLVEDGELTIPYEVVQVPHHGSSSSSSVLLVQYTQPLLAIAQTGYLNRFKHPVPEIRQRWEDNGAVFLNTADTGAVHVVSQAMGIAYYRWREQHRRYWHR